MSWCRKQCRPPPRSLTQVTCATATSSLAVPPRRFAAAGGRMRRAVPSGSAIATTGARPSATEKSIAPLHGPAPAVFDARTDHEAGPAASATPGLCAAHGAPGGTASLGWRQVHLDARVGAARVVHPQPVPSWPSPPIATRTSGSWSRRRRTDCSSVGADGGLDVMVQVKRREALNDAVGDRGATVNEPAWVGEPDMKPVAAASQPRRQPGGRERQRRAFGIGADQGSVTAPRRAGDSVRPGLPGSAADCCRCTPRGSRPLDWAREVRRHRETVSLPRGRSLST